MTLFTDGPISDTADLQRYENDILSVATVEGIDLGAKIVLAQQDLANEVLLFLLRRSSVRDSPLAFRQLREVNDVVVSGPMRQWHVHKTLALVYRDAYNNQLNDRYQGKWKEYEQLAKGSEATYFQIGVGLVADPVPKAPSPTLSSTTGTASGGMYYVAVTWVNSVGHEGAPSDFVELATSDGQQLMVTVGGAPANVAGWNVYVGLSPSTVNLQNQGAPVTSSSWTMTSGPNPGAALPTGQLPSWFVADHHVIERG
jgi:hypothetical protein